jgi:hypothetical protein
VIQTVPKARIRLFRADLAEAAEAAGRGDFTTEADGPDAWR